MNKEGEMKRTILGRSFIQSLIHPLIKQSSHSCINSFIQALPAGPFLCFLHERVALCPCFPQEPIRERRG